MSATIIAFLGCLGGFVLVGILSHRYSRGTSSDYLVASSSVKPWLAGLSATTGGSPAWYA